jgi:hypothetical protein
MSEPKEAVDSLFRPGPFIDLSYHSLKLLHDGFTMKATSNNSEGGFAAPRPEVAATQSGCHPWMEWVLLIVLAIAWGAAHPLIRVAVTTIGPLTQHAVLSHH